VSGASQAVAAALLLTGRADVWNLAALAAVNGASSAFFVPASSGVVPQTVPVSMLQQANATLRLGINATNITGAAIGGLLVAATNPGTAIAIDAGTYGIAALCVGAMTLPEQVRVAGSTVFHELREGWQDFWSRQWLWAIVLQFGLVNAVTAGAVAVLGPLVAKDDLGGPAGWGVVLTAQSLGLVVSGFLMLRWRPQRMLRVATYGAFALALILLALGIPLPLPLVVASAFATGFGIEIFGVLWDTSLQQEIPQEKLSRVSSYDAFGSFVLMPIGFIVAGPIGAAVGTRAAFFGAAAFVVIATSLVLLSPDVRTLRRAEHVHA
jgi:MFS family permease